MTSNDSLQNTNWLKRFVRYLPKGSSLLDYVCAYGRDSKTFSSLGFQTTAIDLSEGMIQKAKEPCPEVDFRVMDMRNLSFANEIFGGICPLKKNYY